MDPPIPATAETQPHAAALADALARVRAARARDLARVWTPPPEPLEPPEEPPRPDPSVRWGPPPADWEEPGPAVSLEQVRRELPDHLLAHARGEGPRVLLVSAPPGAGKSWAAVHAAQELARQGHQVLYLAGYRDYWTTLQAVPAMDRSLWYEWLPIHLNQGDDDRIPTTCRYAPAMLSWLHRGYHGPDLCRQLCLLDGHMARCPFRTQRRRLRRGQVVYAMHHHLVHGIPTDPDYVIVDELPLSALVHERHIPADQLAIPDATGPIAELIQALTDACRRAGRRTIWGPDLMDLIGALLKDVWAQVEHFGLPLPPEVARPEDVEGVPHYYLGELLELLSPEYEAWRHGWPDWARRVWVDRDGLHMVRRMELVYNCRMAVLDATGTREFYRLLLGVGPGDLEHYRPRVQRVGRIHQVVGRLNGSTVLWERGRDGKRLSRHGMRLVDEIRVLVEGTPGPHAVITYRDLVPRLTHIVPMERMAHFGAMRGSNALEGVRTLIIAGSYSPPPQDLVRMAAALSPDRVEAMGARDTQGRWRYPWSRRPVAYRLSPNSPQAREHPGQVPWRELGGYWDDPDLMAVWQQAAVMEVLQAVHRSRVLHQDVDVILLSPYPLPEEVDMVHDDISALIETPRGVSLEMWRAIAGHLREAWSRGQVVYSRDIARWSGMSLARIRNQRVLHAIAQAHPHRWHLCPDPLHHGRGRPQWALVPVEYPHGEPEDGTTPG